MRKELRGSMVFDASVLIELLLSTKGGVLVREMLLSGDLFGYTTEIAVVEAEYVLCRKLGWSEGTRKIKELMLSGFIQTEDISPLCEQAAKYKCERTIALPDCFTLALAKTMAIPALFARRKLELAKEIEESPFDVEVFFLEDFI